MTSLSKNARVAGLLYIVASVVGFVRLGYIPKALFVHGNAAATANNITAHESLFRLGFCQRIARRSPMALSSAGSFIGCSKEWTRASRYLW